MICPFVVKGTSHPPSTLVFCEQLKPPSRKMVVTLVDTHVRVRMICAPHPGSLLFLGSGLAAKTCRSAIKLSVLLFASKALHSAVKALTKT